MTRRIALSIFLTVWTILIVTGIATYARVRSLLLADLDAALVEEAADLPELTPRPGRRVAPRTALADGDRYLIKNQSDLRTYRPAAEPREAAENKAAENKVAEDKAAEDKAAAWTPRLIAANFSTRGERVRQRTVTIAAMARPDRPGHPPRPVYVTYTGSAEQFHRLLDRIALAFALVGVAGGAIAAGLAVAASRRALRPLRRTAEIVGDIDEQRLHRRIPAEQLPPELAPVADRLNEMLQRLESAFAARRRFLADASHELRTPVAALVMGLEVALVRPRDAPAYRKALSDALADAAQLRRLVERLMEQVRSETFHNDEPWAEVDVATLLNDAAALAGTLGAAKEIQVIRRCESPLPAVLQIDRLRSVLTNLVSNAVEYNRPGGSIELSASLAGREVLIDLTDTGAGIAADQLPHLFDPFYRADRARGGGQAGHLGLGLCLVQNHVRALGGRCDVVSELGRGSRFTIRIPIAPEPDAARRCSTTDHPERSDGVLPSDAQPRQLLRRPGVDVREIELEPLYAKISGEK